MTPRRSPLFTRRRVLTGLGVGFVATGVSETGAFDSVEAPRTSTIQVTGDENAILTLQGFDESETYDSPHEVTVTNNTGTKLSGDPNNTVSSANGRLKFRPDSTKSSSQTLKLNELSKDGPEESQTFEIVTASGETGDVSDDVTLSYADPNEISIEATRNITVSYKSSGRLIYAIENDVRVYNAVQDEELSPRNQTNADVIGGSAADFTAGDNADIAFAPTSNGMYSTEVGADGENEIKGGSPSDHDILKQNTRFALAKWPGIDGENDTGVKPNEYVVVYANSGTDKLFAMDADGNTEEIESPSNGAAGAAGVADIDTDSEKEMVFVDGSQGLRYLNQDGSTSKMGDVQVGSDSSTGFGPPASFENFSNVQVPFIDGSGQPSLVDYDGNETTLANDIAKKAACAPVDVDDDGKLEFVFIKSNGNIAYVNDVGDDIGSDSNVKELVIGKGVEGGENVTRAPDASAGLNSGTRPDS
ncbi:hypothetical protein BRC84_03370 [Halobacteriales archaeon QS_1_68_44]|nr:MAG: hypothetical protein BRC84_03370 [Halobacteriales archaeon QS_1_68_44]